MKHERRRYIVFKLPPGTLRRKLTQSLVYFNSTIKTGGDGIRLIFYDEGSGNGIIRCRHALLDKTKRYMTDGAPDLGFNVFGVSGTIKRARRKFLSEQKILR